jgi:hypothetical protein
MSEEPPRVPKPGVTDTIDQPPPDIPAVPPPGIPPLGPPAPDLAPLPHLEVPVAGRTFPDS